MHTVGRRVVDAHMHLYDDREIRYAHLERTDAMFEALIGDYSTLPRRYLFEDYARDMSGWEIAGIVWHEFLAVDAVREVEWAERLAEKVPVPMAIVGLVDFLAPDLEARLDAYAGCAHVVAVREHLGWDERDPMRRFATRGDLLTDARWREGLSLLKKYRFKCSLEVFSPQLPDVCAMVQRNSEIGFTVAVMGWPASVDDTQFARWKRDMGALAACENVLVSVSALECVFGMSWEVSDARRWVDAVMELFGTERVMFGSHRPISLLARKVANPYNVYEEMTRNLSEAERDAVFRGNAARWFFGWRRESA
jgi:predicted TIM-barrel fold metal-dependent hydrolase